MAGARTPIPVQVLMHGLIEDTTNISSVTSFGNVLAKNEKMKAYEQAIGSENIPKNETADAKKRRLENRYHVDGGFKDICKEPLFHFKENGELEWITNEKPIDTLIDTDVEQAAKRLNNQGLILNNQKLHYIRDPDDSSRYWIWWNQKEGGANHPGELGGMYMQFARIGNRLHLDGRLPIPYEYLIDELEPEALEPQPRGAMGKRDTDAKTKLVRVDKVWGEYVASNLLDDLYDQRGDMFAKVGMVRPNNLPHYKNEEEQQRYYAIAEIERILKKDGFHPIFEGNYSLIALMGDLHTVPLPVLINLKDFLKRNHTPAQAKAYIMPNILNQMDPILRKSIYKKTMHFLNEIDDLLDAYEKEAGYFDENTPNFKPKAVELMDRMEEMQKIRLAAQFNPFSDVFKNNEWNAFIQDGDRILNDNLNNRITDDQFLDQMIAHLEKQILEHKNRVAFNQQESNDANNATNPTRDNYIFSYFIPNYSGDLFKVATNGETKERVNLFVDDFLNVVRYKEKEKRDTHQNRAFILEKSNAKDPARDYSNTGHRKQFAQAVVWRLLIHDAGVHNGNLGVNTLGKKGQITSFDNGAGLVNICKDHQYDAYSATNNWVPVWTLAQHFREYGYRVMHMEEMADEFIAAFHSEKGTPKKIRESLEKSLDELDARYSANGAADYEANVQAFLTRIGYEASDKNTIKNVNDDRVVRAIQKGITRNMEYYYYTKGLVLKIAHLFGKKPYQFDEIEKFIAQEKDGLNKLLTSNEKIHVEARDLLQKYCSGGAFYNNKILKHGIIGKDNKPIARSNHEDVMAILQIMMNEGGLTKKPPAANSDERLQNLEDLRQMVLNDRLQYGDKTRLANQLDRVSAAIVALSRAWTANNADGVSLETNLRLAMEELKKSSSRLLGDYLVQRYNTVLGFDLQVQTLHDPLSDADNARVITRSIYNVKKDKTIAEDVTVYEAEDQDKLRDKLADILNPPDADEEEEEADIEDAALILRAGGAAPPPEFQIKVRGQEVKEGEYVLHQPFAQVKPIPDSEDEVQKALGALKRTAIVSSFEIDRVKNTRTVTAKVYFGDAKTLLVGQDSSNIFPSSYLLAFTYKCLNVSVFPFMQEGSSLIIDKYLPPDISVDQTKLFVMAVILACQKARVPYHLSEPYQSLNDPRSWEEHDYDLSKNQMKFGFLKVRKTFQDHVDEMDAKWKKYGRALDRALEKETGLLESDLEESKIARGGKKGSPDFAKLEQSKTAVHSVLHEQAVTMKKK